MDIEGSEVDIMFRFLDIDGSDCIDYHEFIKKLRRAGVDIRNEAEKIVYDFYKKMAIA